MRGLRNPRNKTRVTLFHMTINSNKRGRNAAESAALESALEGQVQTFLSGWKDWLVADDVARVNEPTYEGSIEVGGKTGKVHAHLVCKWVHTSWVHFRETLAAIREFRLTRGLDLFSYVRVQPARADEDYLKLYADKEPGGIRISSTRRV